VSEKTRFGDSCPKLVLMHQSSEPVASTNKWAVGVWRFHRRRRQHRRRQCWCRNLLTNPLMWATAVVGP
jgi:hypothetical protein